MSTSSLTADRASFLLHAMGLPALRAEHPLTCAVIEAIPAAHAAFRPHTDSRSAIDLAWHIASAEIKYLDAAAAGVFPHDLKALPDTVRTPADVLTWYRERFGPAIERLEQTTGDDLLRIVDFYGIRQFPAVALIQIILNHTIHHRGQLSTYLRPMGARVPSIYGPSFDAGGFSGGTVTLPRR
ncbi:MAG TPA: DinB family protein [Vicinamibacterales bacterium]|nr:DinB family protein [Vicinamibacterales bacterium]